MPAENGALVALAPQREAVLLGALGRHMLSGPPDLWGGIECSVVRIGDSWRDQVRETGHHDRGTDDIDRLAGLGIGTVRYPILWERVSGPAGVATGWDWHDRQLNRLQRCGINVMAGLLHHGSGPAGTDLLDPDFAERLAGHAGAVAQRYPFINQWVVVNEPLTTARFSCLYGHWYPHLWDEGAFMRAVVNQCRASLLAARAIRSHRPRAQFVQTEDIGRVFATPPLADQARYENERRWLSLDLLCGRVDRSHPWHAAMLQHGVAARDLAELATGEATPDLIGVNHYATSDRFLDHRTTHYPAECRASNGRQIYADTEAVRARLNGATGWEARLREVWERYNRPLAVTEAHLGCHDARDSVRWLMEAWSVSCLLRGEGIPVRAVTAWALFGLVDWDSMLLERHGRLEPGAFDTRFDPPRTTCIAHALEALARTGRFTDQCLDEPGWWRRSDRFFAGVDT